MSARSLAASWAQKRAIANPFQQEIPTSPPNEFATSRIRSTSASSPGTISAVPMATPPLAIAGLPACRRCRRRDARFRRTPVCPPRRNRQRSTNSPCSMRSPIAARPNTTISHNSSDALSARSISMRRNTRARSNRMVSCGSQARCAPLGRLQGDVDLRRRALRPIDLFGGGCRHRQARALAGRDIDVETIAAGNAARGVDENRREAVGFRRRETNPQRAGFMQMAAAGDTLEQLHVERHRALRPVGRENRRGRTRGIGPHPPPDLPKSAHGHRRPRHQFAYSAIWRLISLGSRLLRSQANFTAPRSMTAKLSPSSQAKSRYCSTSTIAMVPRLRR